MTGHDRWAEQQAALQQQLESLPDEERQELERRTVARMAPPHRPVAWSNSTDDDFWGLLQTLAEDTHMQSLVGWARGLEPQQLLYVTYLSRALVDREQWEPGQPVHEFRPAIEQQLGIFAIGLLSTDEEVRTRILLDFQRWHEQELADEAQGVRRAILRNIADGASPPLTEPVEEEPHGHSRLD